MKKIIIGKKKKKKISENLNWAYYPIVLKKKIQNFFCIATLGLVL